jgi:hypothetical protein
MAPEKNVRHQSCGVLMVGSDEVVVAHGAAVAI